MSSEWIKRHLDRWSSLDERMPVDVLPASNGEFLPPPPTEKQHQVMAMQDEAAEAMSCSRKTIKERLAEFRTTASALLGSNPLEGSPS